MGDPASCSCSFWFSVLPLGCRIGLTFTSKFFMTYIQYEMTPTVKQHPRMASCLGVKISLLDLEDPSSTPWSVSGLQMYVFCAPAECWNRWLLWAGLFMCVLTRSFLLDQRNLFPVEVLLKLICVNNRKNMLWGMTKWQNQFSAQIRVKTYVCQRFKSVSVPLFPLAKI